MIKKVNVQQLKIGMFIHDLNCGWLGHDFLKSKFLIKNTETLVKVKKQGMKELFIDTSKGLDVSTDTQGKELKPESSIIKTTERNIIAPAAFGEEITKAKKIKKEVVKIVSELMLDVRAGKQINVNKVDDMVDNMVESVYRNRDAMMCLGMLKDVDEYTFLHSVNVCILMVTFCKAMNFEKDAAQKVGVGALLHDIGKMKVPMTVLNKPGKLTDEEFNIMKSHVTFGKEILSDLSTVSDISKSIACEHHERFDGTGYASGLKGNTISKYGQMAAIVDVFDAITSNRCYHKGMTAYEALQKILEWSKQHFNKTLVEKYIDCVGIYPIKTLVRLEDGTLGIVVRPGIANPLQPTVNVFYNTIKRQLMIPKEVDLEKSASKGAPNNIICYEPPEQWNIDISSYMPVF
ncbi:MAG: HD-GYP domain-containing protein [Nitrospirae bacterium]|nr:HD-GYP domain-containing protein [Nitrospirota bacterium]